MPRIIIGVMGPGEGARSEDCQQAFDLGRLIAQQDWVLLTGGRNAGVMDAASRGAKSVGGLTVGILPGTDVQDCSEAVDLAIATGLGQGRNVINVLSANVVIACGIGLGTVSEIALALKSGKSVILLNRHQPTQVLFLSLAPAQLAIAATPVEAITLVKEILGVT